MSHDLPDLTLLLQLGQRLPSEAAVDLEAVNQGSDRDQAVGLDILVELLLGGLVEDNGVVGLVLDCSNPSDRVRFPFPQNQRAQRTLALGPLLLLLLAAGRCWCLFTKG